LTISQITAIADFEQR